MDYREKSAKAWKDYRNERGITDSISLADLSEYHPPRPKHGDTWGRWKYNAKTMVLTYLPEDYEIDLEECTSSAQTLDWIFQLCNKTWMEPKDLGNLVEALDDLLKPQANLCSFGVDKKFDVTRHLKNLGKAKGKGQK